MSTAQEMTRELLEKIKAAAVFFEVSHSGPGKIDSFGSGWVIEKDAKGVLVVTNRHVVLNDEDHKGTIQCVFYPGTDKESRVAANIIVVDPDEDLAVVRVEGVNLPEAMPTLKDTASLFETMKVYTVGFPLAVAFKYGQRAPSVTIVETTINGLRRLDNNRLVEITVNGGSQPGNSGGMLVSAKGEVVGVVNAVNSFTDNIGYSIPVSQVHVLFNGKAEKVIGIPVASNDPSKVVVNFYVNCFDPKGGIVELEFLHGPGSLVQGMKPEQIAITRTPLAGMSAPIKMQYDKSRAQAHCQVTFNAADVMNKDVTFQVVTKRNDNLKWATAPISVRIDTKKEFAFSPGYKETIANAALGSANGLTADTKTIKMDGPVTDMIPAGSGRFLLIRAKGDIAVVDLTKRERVKTINVADESLVAGGADFFVIFNSFTHKFEKWSLTTLEKVMEATPPKDLKPIEIALGHSSNGPLFVYDIPKMMVPSGDARLSCAFLSLDDFKGKIETLYEGPLPRVQGAGDGFGALTQAEVRAAGNGSCFTMWRPFTLPQGMAVIRNKRVKGKLSIDNEEDTGLYVVPSTDGETICTAQGAKSSDLKRDKMSGFFLPCTDREHILSLSKKGLDLRSTATGSTIQSFPPVFPEIDSAPSKEGVIEFFMTLDKRIVCSPHYDMLAMSFPGQSSVAISKLGLNLQSTPSPSGGAPPVQIANGTMRAWTNPAGKQIKAKLLSVSADGVELQLEKGGTAKVSFDKLSEADVKYAKFEGDKARGALGGK